jgi:hypothetical protein
VALPVLCRITLIDGAATPGSVDAKVIDDGVAESVAPVGVALSANDTFLCVGSLVRSDSDPVSGELVDAVDGMLAVRVSVLEDPAGIESEVVVIENAVPDIDASTDSVEPPRFAIASDSVP